MINFQQNKPDMTVPLFSIVIPTFNRPDYLKVCLESLYDQIPQGNNIEVTVVDDFSQSDNFNQNQFISNVFGFTCIRHNENMGVASARNTGIKNSRGKWIVFLDDDVKINKFWFSRLLTLLTDLSSDIIGVEGKVESSGHGIWDKEVENLYGNNYLTCNYCIRKDILAGVGGFDPFFKKVCDDHEITSRILPHGKIVFDPELSVTHLSRKISLFSYVISSPSRIKLLLDSEYFFYKKNPDRYWQFRICRTFWGTFSRIIFRNIINEIRRRSFNSIIKHPLQFLTLVLSSIIEQIFSLFMIPHFLKSWINNGSGLTWEHFNTSETASIWKTDISSTNILKLKPHLFHSLFFKCNRKPVYDLRYTLNNISRYSSIESAIFFLRIDDLFLDKKDLVSDFCKIMKNHDIPYLAAITGNDLKNPDNHYLIENIIESNGEPALHGFSHNGKFGPFNSEILQLRNSELDEKINHIPLKNLPFAFIPPFNSIGPQQILYLSKRFRVICGGPETARFTGRYCGPVALKNNSWYFPSFYPFYANSGFLLKRNLLTKANIYKAFICITLHFPEEAKDGFKNLETLLSSFPSRPLPWNFFLKRKDHH